MIELDTDAPQVLEAFGRQLKTFADGKQLKRAFTKRIRDAAQPAISEARSSLLGMATGGMRSGDEPLRPAVARKIVTEVRLSGRSPGIRIRQKQTPGVRGFNLAGRRLNATGGWRHPVFGSDTWVEQVGKPRWFDDAMRNHRTEFNKAAQDAMGDLAKEIMQKVG